MMSDKLVSIPIDVGVTTINRIRLVAENMGMNVDSFVALALEERLTKSIPQFDYSKWAMAHKYVSDAAAVKYLFPELLKHDVQLANLVAAVDKANHDIHEIMKARWDEQSNGAEYEDA